MRHQKAVLRPRGRRPRAHARAGPRLQQIDRCAAAEVVLAAVRRQRFLVRAPAELGGLHALGDEALDRPGIDELPGRLGIAGALGVALGDVDTLDPGALREPRPVLARLRLVELEAGIARDVEHCLLDHPGHHARVGPAAAHRGDAAAAPAAQIEQSFAQRVVRALRDRALGVGIEARPRLDDGVDVERVEILGELDQRDRGGVDRQIDHHAAARPRLEQRGQDLTVVVLRDAEVHEPQLPLVEQVVVGIIGRDHHELRTVERDVALDQRQGSLADRAEADHHDGPVEAGEQGGVIHFAATPTLKTNANPSSRARHDITMTGVGAGPGKGLPRT